MKIPRKFVPALAVMAYLVMTVVVVAPYQRLGLKRSVTTYMGPYIERAVSRLKRVDYLGWVRR